MGHDAQWAILARSITSDLHVKRSLLSFHLNQNLIVPINTKFHENPYTRCREVTNGQTWQSEQPRFFFSRNAPKTQKKSVI